MKRVKTVLKPIDRFVSHIEDEPNLLTLSRAGVAEWLSVPCLLRVTWTVMGSSPDPPPMLVSRYMDQKGSAAMLTPIQSTGVAPEEPEEFIAHRPQSTQARDPPWP